MTEHPLAGRLSVDASARRIRQYRWLEERLMRTLGGWIALTPELPVKLLFGRHVWDCAQHADLWGRRLPELRSQAHVGEPPSEGFARLMDVIDGLHTRHESLERVVAVYRVIKPHLVDAYETHQTEANAVYEPPTRRILARCVEEERRHVAAARVVLDRLVQGEGGRRADEWEQHLVGELARAGGLVAPAASHSPVTTAPDTSGDLVALDSVFDPSVLGEELTTVVNTHREALVSGNEAAIVVQLAPTVRSTLVELYRSAGPIAGAAVVGCARIGAYRIVKLALRGPRALSIVQLEWRRGDDGWRVVSGDVVRAEPLT